MKTQITGCFIDKIPRIYLEHHRKTEANPIDLYPKVIDNLKRT
jgi:hypothetical protein